MRSVTLALSLAFATAGMTAPAFAKHHQGEKPEAHRQDGKAPSKVAQPSNRKAKDDPATHDAKDDKGQGGKQKDDAAGHH